MLTKATKEQKSLVKNRGAELVVDCLVEQGVTHVFGIPGAKIDAVFDALQDKGPEIIVARHEQNAAFIPSSLPFNWKTGSRVSHIRTGCL